MVTGGRNLARRAGFLLIHETGLDHRRLGPRARIPFDGKGDDREEDRRREERDTDQHDPLSEQGRERQQHHADHQDRHRHLAGDVRHRHHGRAHLEPLVPLRVLQRMARLVAGDADGRDRARIIDRLRQAQRPVARIVMVAETPRDRLDPAIRDPRPLQHEAGGFGPGHVALSSDGLVFLEGVLHHPGCPTGQDHARKHDKKHVGHIEIHEGASFKNAKDGRRSSEIG